AAPRAGRSRRGSRAASPTRPSPSAAGTPDTGPPTTATTSALPRGRRAVPWPAPNRRASASPGDDHLNARDGVVAVALAVGARRHRLHRAVHVRRAAHQRLGAGGERHVGRPGTPCVLAEHGTQRAVGPRP